MIDAATEPPGEDSPGGLRLQSADLSAYLAYLLLAVLAVVTAVH